MSHQQKVIQKVIHKPSPASWGSLGMLDASMIFHGIPWHSMASTCLEVPGEARLQAMLGRSLSGRRLPVLKGRGIDAAPEPSREALPQGRDAGSTAGGASFACENGEFRINYRSPKSISPLKILTLRKLFVDVDCAVCHLADMNSSDLWMIGSSGAKCNSS